MNRKVDFVCFARQRQLHCYYNTATFVWILSDPVNPRGQRSDIRSPVGYNEPEPTLSRVSRLLSSVNTFECATITDFNPFAVKYTPTVAESHVRCSEPDPQLYRPSSPCLPMSISGLSWRRQRWMKNEWVQLLPFPPWSPRTVNLLFFFFFYYSLIYFFFLSKHLFLCENVHIFLFVL